MNYALKKAEQVDDKKLTSLLDINFKMSLLLTSDVTLVIGGESWQNEVCHSESIGKYGQARTLAWTSAVVPRH